MNKTILAHGAAAAAALSAGTAVVATRYVIGETDPVSLAFYRYVIGSLCFVPLLPFIWPRHRLQPVDYGKIALLGFLFFGLFTWGFNASLQYIPASRAAVGLATIPVQTLIIAALFGREKLTLMKVISVVMAFLGIVVAIGPETMDLSSSGSFMGEALMMFAVLCAALYSVFSRNTLKEHGPTFVTALAMMFGVLALLPVSLFTEGMNGIPDFSTRGWMAVIFLGTIAGAVQFALFTWALRWLPPTTTVLYLTLNPVTAMALGVLLIGETVTWPLVMGLVLVLVAIFLGSGVLADLWRALRSGNSA
jgi:drug/metabolite transporter (DMT)-like permease